MLWQILMNETAPLNIQNKPAAPTEVALGSFVLIKALKCVTSLEMMWNTWFM